MGRQNEGGEVAEDHSADQGAGDRSNDNRRKGREGVVADHHLEREEASRDRRVERAGDRRCDAATEQGARQAAAEVQTLSDPGSKRGAEVDHRAFTPNRCTDTDRSRTGKRRLEADGQGHAPAVQRRGFDDMGNTLGAATRHEVIGENPDGKPAKARHQEQLPPRQSRRQGRDPLAAKAEGAILYEGDEQAEARRSQARGHTNSHGEDR